ncbi:MAG TPA: hypothetical protein VMH28_02840 [Candidatus Acidoferrales bacterium]|nr:hypothetical protein [Candidatus Acidoferrales bacterium]
MWNSTQRLLLAIALAGASAGYGQDTAISSDAVQINLPPNSPLAIRGVTMGNSRATARGAALSLDLHMAVTLENKSPNRIHGVVLRVVAQEVVLGGKGSVTYPSLNVGPGESLPARIDLQLMRPSQIASGPLVQVDLDGVLFQDLSFFGPNRLNSQRTLTACEMEARRDREHFKRVLAQNGRNGLQAEILQSMNRQAESAQLAVTVKRGRTVSGAGSPEHTAEFAFLKFPDSPIEPLKGSAQIAGNEARAPHIEVLNRSNKPVKYVEIGWIVSDVSGRQYMAGALPSADTDLLLPPSKTGQLLQDTTLSFSAKGQPVGVQRMMGFVSQVEFADGKIWVPNRESLENAILLKVLPPSPEEQRLTDLYRKRGMDALVAELNRF